jgi:hypothetical protein
MADDAGGRAGSKDRKPQLTWTSEVQVTHEGRLLTMSYRLLDANGRSAIDRQAPPPHFSISQNGQEIGSGSFEYG